MTCPLCKDEFIIVTAGPDYFGNYDTDDCYCQRGWTAEDVQNMVDERNEREGRTAAYER